MIKNPIILITIGTPEQESDVVSTGGNKGYNGLGIHKKVVTPSSKLEDETQPKLNADLDVNQQSLMNIGWLESDFVGINEVLLGQSTTPVEDYGYCGISWKTINNKYFGASAQFDNSTNEYKLTFSSPNPNITPNAWIEFIRRVRYNIPLSELEMLDDKALANKEWVLSKLPMSGISKLEDDLTPKLGGNLDANGKAITGGYMLGLQHLADVNNYCKIYHVPADEVMGLEEGWVLSSILNIYVNRLVSYLTIDNINNLSGLTGKVLVTKEWVESKLPAGATNTFTSQDGKTITVTNGIITNIV